MADNYGDYVGKAYCLDSWYQKNNKAQLDNRNGLYKWSRLDPDIKHDASDLEGDHRNKQHGP